MIVTFLYRYREVSKTTGKLDLFLFENYHFTSFSFIIHDYNIFRLFNKKSYLVEEKLLLYVERSFSALYYILGMKKKIDIPDIDRFKSTEGDETIDDVLVKIIQYYEKVSKCKIFIFDISENIKPQILSTDGTFTLYCEGFVIFSSVNLLEVFILWFSMFDLFNFKCLSRCLYDVYKLIVYSKFKISIMRCFTYTLIHFFR